MNIREIIEALQDLEPSGLTVKIYVDGKLYDVMNVTAQGSEDPDIEPAVVIRAH